MSEYQYYEFQAIDRPLTQQEMGVLRGRSSRAQITPTSFVNEYAWGSFRGDEDAWMNQYFDAFIYLASWGTHVLKLRLPARFLDLETARRYAVGHEASARKNSSNVILTFRSEEEGGDGWVVGEGQLSSLIGVRDELIRGDLRALYLGWLLCAQIGDLADDVVEPPVPAGLLELSASLEHLAWFLRLDPDLVRVAAANSPPLVNHEPTPADVRQWVAGLAASEKDEVLTRVLVEGDAGPARELLHRLRREHAGAARSSAPPARRRTVGELMRDAEEAAAERQRAAEAESERERARQERDAAIARMKYVQGLAGKEPGLWRQVESLVGTKQPKAYDRAVALLVDLRDLAAGGTDFQRRIARLRADHARKTTLIARLDEAGLGQPVPDAGRPVGGSRSGANV